MGDAFRKGRNGGEERLVAVPQKANVTGFFSSSRRGDASPSTALQTVWHMGHRRKPLERSEP